MRDDEDEDGSPAERQDKKRQRDGDNDDDEDDGNENNSNDEDKAFQDRFDMTAQSLVQQVTDSPISIKMMLIYRHPPGVGTSRTSRRECHRP